jgi:hypothetical protein
MNRDQYDDELDDDDIEDEDDDILKDGESLKVPINFMDSVQRSIADGFDADNHRPGWRVPDHIRDQDKVVADAYEERNRWMRDAHKPAAATGSFGPVAKRPASLADARAAADAAYEERNEWMRNAHKERRP